MKKYKYRLMAKGLKKEVIIAGQRISCKRIFGKETIDSVYYSKEYSVIGNNEKVIRYEIEQKLGHKWSGFRLIKS